MSSFADRIIAFYTNLKFSGPLPAGISVMNPYINNSRALPVIISFYRKYYSDNGSRQLILGINPGRFGAGVTGIPFTDTERLKDKCGLSIPGIKTHETSSVFIYEMIERYGGPEKFYRDFFIGAVSPLGFTRMRSNGKEVNYNYYDSRELADSIVHFVVDSLKRQLDFGIDRTICFCLGSGKNFRFLSDLNSRHNFFNRIEPLEHPRFIMQYRSKQKEYYINHYIQKFNQ